MSIKPNLDLGSKVTHMSIQKGFPSTDEDDWNPQRWGDQTANSIGQGGSEMTIDFGQIDHRK